MASAAEQLAANINFGAFAKATELKQRIWFTLLAFPGTVLGAWLGARTYHALNDKNFADVVLGLLFLSGVGLVWSSLGLS